MHRAMSPPHPNPLPRGERDKYGARERVRPSSLPLPLRERVGVRGETSASSPADSGVEEAGWDTRKTRHRRQLQFGATAAALWLAFQIPLASAAEPSAPAAQSSSAPSTKEPAAGSGPEYRTRAMPTDTFNPSEKVSEDYPIAFPADI